MESYADLVSSGPAVAHANKLVHAGMSAKDIVARSGVSHSVVQLIIAGSRESVRRITEECILGVPVPEEGYFPKNEGLTWPTGTTRRLQALAVQGFPLSLIEGPAGVPERTLNGVRSGQREKIQISCMLGVRKAHDLFWDEDPADHGATRQQIGLARACARRGGWFPTEAWTDIDDPECEPMTKPTPKYIRVTEDYRELTERFGLDRRQAADRLGMSVDALNAALGYYEKRMAAAS